MQSSSTACRIQLDAASFHLTSATLSLEEIGALLVLATVCAGGGGTIPCDEMGRPVTRALGEHRDRLWPKIAQFFDRDGDRLSPGPACPCHSQAAKARAKKAAKAPREWVGTPPLHLGTAWDDWLRFRREDLRKPVTQRAGDAQLAQLAQWGEKAALEAIRASIAAGWQGLFKPKPEAAQVSKFPTSTSRYVPTAEERERRRKEEMAALALLGSRVRSSGPVAAFGGAR